MKAKRIIAMFLCIIMAMSLCGCKKQDYESAVELMNNGEYDAAKEMFLTLGDYKDAADKAKNCDYEKAQKYLAKKDYDSAIKILETISDYQDSSSLIIYSKYNKANLLMEKEDYAAAGALYGQIPGYQDSNDKKYICDHVFVPAAINQGVIDEMEAHDFTNISFSKKEGEETYYMYDGKASIGSVVYNHMKTDRKAVNDGMKNHLSYMVASTASNLSTYYAVFNVVSACFITSVDPSMDYKTALTLMLEKSEQAVKKTNTAVKFTNGDFDYQCVVLVLSNTAIFSFQAENNKLVTAD